ncbi:hypothetical protein [Oscillatoria sp. FACHB-1406]|uniref:hypothetical protein n=1 Tax=Oscillatoria sp. FACHB-1406 TaxID=2692846 RepID=UPI0016826D21|nr:hypothetical protein [Oscillatoria sp. FACHB-1406]MBD2579518.1 hypothetical protein [Oscillatoria sp. FACHB-1406]
MFAPTSLTKLSTAVVGTAIATLAFSPSSRAASLYTPTLVFDPSSNPSLSSFSSLANDINEAGEVVGTYGSIVSSGAFRWSPTTGTQLLNAPSGGQIVVGNAINDAGIAVGSSIGSMGFTLQGYGLSWWSGVQPQLLPNFPSGGNVANAMDINSRGQIVGSAILNNSSRAVLWDNNQILDLGVTGQAAAIAINESGWVIGNTYNNVGFGDLFNPGSNPGKGFLWKNGQITNFGNLMEAIDLNDRGQIVGTSKCGNSTCASIWDNGTITQFGANTLARGINNLGWVVGSTKADNITQQRALLWKDGNAIDLNTLVDPSLGWTFYEATAINDKGQIVGKAYAPNSSPVGWPHTYAFLLTPIEQSTPPTPPTPPVTPPSPPVTPPSPPVTPPSPPVTPPTPPVAPPTPPVTPPTPPVTPPTPPTPPIPPSPPVTPPTQVPEPSLLLGLAAMGAGFSCYRRYNR